MATRKNLCTNPSMETDVAGWVKAFTRTGITAGTVSRSNTITSLSGAGAWYGFVNVTGNGTTSTTSDLDIALPGTIAVTAGLTYAVSLYMRHAVTGTYTSMAIVWKNSTGGVISTSVGNGVNNPVTSWGRNSLIAVAPTGATQASVQVRLSGCTDTASRSFRWEAGLIEKSSTVDSYFDGATTGAVWDGVAHASTSTLGTATAVQASVAFAAAVILKATAKHVKQAKVSLAVSADLSVSPRTTVRASLPLVVAGTLDVRAALVQNMSAQFIVQGSSRISMQRVFHTAALPMFVTVELGTVGIVGAPPPGLTIISRRRLYVPARRRGIRYIVQDILTKEFLEWDLPLSDVERTYTLSGPKGIRGKIDPEYPDLADLGVKSRGTWIHAESDGVIRGSGIVQPGSLEGDSLSIDCSGFTSYAHLIPFSGVYSGVQVDPLDVIRLLWDHIQSFPTSNMGVTVDPTTSPVRIGYPERDVNFETQAGEQVSFSAGPYKLNWWTDTKCGQEMDNLARECPVDYLEQDHWNADKTDILHNLALGYPRVGRQQSDLYFVLDENIIEQPKLREHPNLGASEVAVLGAGEGSAKVRGSYIGQPSGRLRVPITVEDADVTRVERANAFAEDEYLRRQEVIEIEQIKVDLNHENARLGTFNEGDDILVQSPFAYVGRLALWHRVMSYAVDDDKGVGVISLRRSETFRYGARI